MDGEPVDLRYAESHDQAIVGDKSIAPAPQDSSRLLKVLEVMNSGRTGKLVTVMRATATAAGFSWNS